MLLAAVPACQVSPVMSISLGPLREQVLSAQGTAAKKVPINGLTLGPIIVAAGRSRVYKGSFSGMAVSIKVGAAQRGCTCCCYCGQLQHHRSASQGPAHHALSCVLSLCRQCDQALMQDSVLCSAGMAGSAPCTATGAVQVSQMPAGAADAARSPLPC